MVIDGKDYSEQLAELTTFIDSLPTTEGKLIVILHKAQDLFGFLPRELQNFIASKLKISSAKVYGVVTFYSFFNMEKKGNFKVAVCLGTACFVRGADDIMDEFKKELNLEAGGMTKDGMFSLDGIRCVGACGLAPVVSVNGKVYGRVKKEDVKTIIEEQMAKGGE